MTSMSRPGPGHPAPTQLAVLGTLAALAAACGGAGNLATAGVDPSASPAASADASSSDEDPDAGGLAYGCAGPAAADGRPLICNLAHYAFRVTDLQKAKVFYGDFLGLEEPFPDLQTDGGVSVAVYKINDSQFIELYEEPPPANDTNYQLKDIAFYTSDAEALRQYFAAHGVSVPASVSQNLLGNVSFTVVDQDQHTIEWVQYTQGSMTGTTVGAAMPASRIGGSVHHLGVTIQNPTAASAFYQTLGFLPSRTGPSAPLPPDKEAEEDPNSTVRIEYGVSPSGPPTAAFAVIRDHLCLRVPDTMQAVGILNARNQDIYVEHHVLDGFTVRANTYDPDGSRIELADSILEFDGGEATGPEEEGELDSGANDDASFVSTY
jgi:catechol 2,3-dioxygenase-like lactoylglutathione lyase family enzyme